ncbi:tRNA dimethylallyltransferase [[Candida] jaroonii]|uniref:tRNA dimethylallyltransferase n=1 Tax=[Candida] jaroonii TaxID=467808 RepID=A0ACA9Y0A7_9ASCO|nr:tRNA dimethylallyltransferase [[Candida] jaroonii]
MRLGYLRYLKNLVMNKQKPPIIAIVGTTGVGKSQFSIDLAKHINGEIVNADSMQVYKKLDLITNKHPMDERNGIPHHVMDYVNWDEEYYIHRFDEEATKAIEDIYSRGKIPIIIGGTHYYLSKLLFKNKTIDDSERRELTNNEKDILDGPVEIIFEELKKYDPTISEKFHPQDKRKLRRALEICYTMGQKPSDLYRDQKLAELEESSLVYRTLVFWVYSDNEILSDRLDKRVDLMIDNGAMTEINELYQFYTSQNEVDLTKGVWQVIGFKEFLPYLHAAKENNKTDKELRKLLDEGIERMKIRTRQYAKYQVKFIKKLLSIELRKEARFNYKHGGKMYLLNASDLTKWDTNVKKRGFSITSKFLENLDKVDDVEIPPELEGLFDNAPEFKSNKLLENQSWKHYKCEICKDQNDKNLVFIGEQKWTDHLNSKRHKRGLVKRQKLNNRMEYERKHTITRDKKEDLQQDKEKQ